MSEKKVTTSRPNCQFKFTFLNDDTVTGQLALVLTKEEVSFRKDVKKRPIFYFSFVVFSKRQRGEKGERKRKYLCQILNIFLSEFLFNKL